MKTYVIEREIPGAAELTHDELRGITSTSNDAVEIARQAVQVAAQLRGRRQGVLRPPGRERGGDPRARQLGGFPANLVAEVTSVFDTTGPRDLPR